MEIFGEDILDVEDMKTVLDALEQNRIRDLFCSMCWLWHRLWEFHTVSAVSKARGQTPCFVHCNVPGS